MKKLISILVSVLLISAALATPSNLPDHVPSHARTKTSQYHHDLDRLNEARDVSLMHPTNSNVLVFLCLLNDFSDKYGLSRGYRPIYASDYSSDHSQPQMMTILSHFAHDFQNDEESNEPAQVARIEKSWPKIKERRTRPKSQHALQVVKIKPGGLKEPVSLRAYQRAELYVPQLNNKMETFRLYQLLVAMRTAHPHVETALYHTMVLSQLEHITLLLKHNRNNPISLFNMTSLPSDGTRLNRVQASKYTLRQKQRKPLNPIMHPIKEDADSSVTSGQ